MKLIYKWGAKEIYSAVSIPKKIGDYLYFIRIGDRIWHKIGTTNDIMRRMKEHAGAKTGYGLPIYILWISPCYSKYTTLRIEDKMKAWWIEKGEWTYQNNDRFTIPENVKEITITVRKDYHISLE